MKQLLDYPVEEAKLVKKLLRAGIKQNYKPELRREYAKSELGRNTANAHADSFPRAIFYAPGMLEGVKSNLIYARVPQRAFEREFINSLIQFSIQLINDGMVDEDHGGSSCESANA